MNKIICCFALFLSLSQLSFAQKTQIEKGEITAALGVGLFPLFAIDGGTIDFWPVSLNVGYRIKEHVSLNAFAGYTAATSATQILADGIPVQYSNNQFLFGLRAEAHAQPRNRLDVYGGVMLGYYLPFVEEQVTTLSPGQEPVELGGPSSNKPYKYAPATAKVVYSGFVGASYLLNKRIGVFGEVGYGVSLLTTGVQLKW